MYHDDKRFSRGIINGCEVETLAFYYKEKKVEEICVDENYCNYIHWIGLYSKGQITMAALDTILIGDNLQRFVKPWDIKRDECTNEQYKKTELFEKRWDAAMMVRRAKPEAWSFALSEILNDVFRA